jgi:hypothetical protein
MQFHLLSFEGPDGYSGAGGIASRIEGLAQALAGLGFKTPLWFVGDPALAGHESHGLLHLHRWCQWISRMLLVAPEDLVSGLPGDADLPTHMAHRLAFQKAGNETQALVHDRTLFPRHRHLPPANCRGKVLPMCPVQNVTHVSGRSDSF